MKKRTETDLVRACVDFLKLRGALAYRQNTGAMTATYKGRDRFIRFAEPGAPDIIACYRGRFVGVECKAPKGKQSDTQAAWQIECEHAGGVYVLARSVDDVEAALAKIERGGE